MTVIGTLWGDGRQCHTKVILSIAALHGFQLEQPKWTFQDKPAEFTTKFPYGKIPTFQGTDGFKLLESTTIARYLCSIGSNSNFLGSSTQETAIVDQWVHFAEHEIGVPVQNLTYLVYGFAGPFSRETLDKNTERLVRALDYLESHLATRSSGYVALDTLTLADFVLASVIFTAATVSLGSAERAQHPHIFKHYARVTADEKVKQYWGTEGFVDARITEPKTLSWS